jgi:hypothetical protein
VSQEERLQKEENFHRQQQLFEMEEFKKRKANARKKKARPDEFISAFVEI